MNKNPFSVRSQNWTSFQSIIKMVTTDHRPALNPTHIRILEYIGSFLPEKGCWESPAKINQQTVNLTIKTFRRHMDYLIHIGAIIQQKNNDGRLMYRIGNPPNNTVISQCAFRINKGLADYSYTRKTTMKDDDDVLSFFDNIEVESTSQVGENLPLHEVESTVREGRIYPQKRENLPLFSSTTTETNQFTQQKETRDLLPPIPPRSSNQTEVLNPVLGLPGPDGPGGRPDGPPVKEGCRLPETANIFSLKENDLEVGDKFFPGKREKKHKTSRERRAEALQKINSGHIANPLGAPDNRKRQHNAKLARAIESTGAVTNAQLWGHLVKLWDTSFGEGILENMVSKDKSAIASMFSELQKKFVDTTGFYPENRDLAEYFTWFLDPKRLSGMLSSAKYNSDKSIHLRQLAGQVYIKRFYDDVISRRKKQDMVIPSKSAVDKVALKLEQIFQEFRENYSNHYEFVLTMVAHGYALAVQYLHDECKMTEEECREHIIQAMLTFYKRVADKEKAVAFLRTGIIATEENENMLISDTCIWYSWKEKTKGLIETVIERGKTV